MGCYRLFRMWIQIENRFRTVMSQQNSNLTDFCELFSESYQQYACKELKKMLLRSQINKNAIKYHSSFKTSSFETKFASYNCQRSVSYCNSVIMLSQPQLSQGIHMLLYVVPILIDVLAIVVNAYYMNLKDGKWTPPLVEPEQLSRRPYEIFMFILYGLSIVARLFYFLRKNSEYLKEPIRAGIRVVVLILALSVSLMGFVLACVQISIYRIYLDTYVNSEWSVTYNVLYYCLIGFGIALWIPSQLYLLVHYFKLLQYRYSLAQEGKEVNKYFNKICFFATYISLIVVMSLNINVLEDYHAWIILPGVGSMEVQLMTPLAYFEYLCTGLVFLLVGFLMVKELFDTEKDVFLKRRRQLVVHLVLIVPLALLIIHRVIEVHRYDRMIDDNNTKEYLYGAVFVYLFGDMKKVLLCYLFLLTPLTAYSIRNKWVEWGNSFPHLQAASNDNGVNKSAANESNRQQQERNKAQKNERDGVEDRLLQ